VLPTLRLILVFLIFDPPEFVNFFDEPLQMCLICCEIDGFNAAHKVLMVVAVAVVESKNPPIVRATPF